MGNFQSKRERVEELMKSIFGGSVALFIGILFGGMFSEIDNPYYEYMLIRYGVTTEGYVRDGGENFQDEDTVWSYNIYSYVFKSPNGQVIVSLKGGRGTLPKDYSDSLRPPPCKVEYLPNNPKVNRLQNNGCQSIFELLLRRFVCGTIFLLILVVPFIWYGGKIIFDGIKNYLSGSGTR